MRKRMNYVVGQVASWASSWVRGVSGMPGRKGWELIYQCVEIGAKGYSVIKVSSVMTVKTFGAAGSVSGVAARIV